jgi:hypothetical protein
MNRHYQRAWGRFTTMDPYSGSANPANPQSWNRYNYVESDPANKYDPSGLSAIGFCAGSTSAGMGSAVEAMCAMMFGPRPSIAELYNSSGEALGMADGSGGGSMIGRMGGETAAAETDHVMGTVVPGYIRSALTRNPVLTEAVLPPGAVSATITYGNHDRSSAILSALTVLPEMFWTGFGNMLLNDDPKGALQVAGSIALAVGPGQVARLLSGSQTAIDGSVLVSRWGSEIQPGSWVMRGEANWFNYALSGKWQPGMGNQFAPFSSGVSSWVPRSSLQVGREYGLGLLKAPLGQSVYSPISIWP